jgi:ABC-type nitrate/sulfonate/bicarbonate transport system substrate-binding protein
LCGATFEGNHIMLRRHILAAAGATLAAPAIVSRAALGQGLRKVKMGSAFTTTTNAAFLMPALLKPEGIDLELVMFPSLVQRMQAVASGDVDIGNGGLSATMQVATKGFPMQVLANGCDGGWMVLAQPSIKSFKDLVGKKVAHPSEYVDNPAGMGGVPQPDAVVLDGRILTASTPGDSADAARQLVQAMKSTR